MKLAPQKFLAESYFLHFQPSDISRGRLHIAMPRPFDSWREPGIFLLQISITSCGGQLSRIEEQDLERNDKVDARVGSKVEIDDHQGPENG